MIVESVHLCLIVAVTSSFYNAFPAMMDINLELWNKMALSPFSGFCQDILSQP